MIKNLEARLHNSISEMKGMKPVLNFILEKMSFAKSNIVIEISSQ